jgi:hypothetical protein
MALAPAQAIPAATPALATFAVELSGLGADGFGTFVIDSVGTFGIDTVGTFAIDAAEIPLALESAPAATGGIPGFPAPVMASMGQAAPVGRLSVPQSWTMATPAFHTVAAALPSTNISRAAEAVPAAARNTFADMVTAGTPGRAVGSSATPNRGEPGASRARKRLRPRSLRSPVTSVAAELRKLARLRDSGKLTEEEFTEQKRRLLGH